MTFFCNGSDLNRLIADISNMKIKYEGVNNSFYHIWGPGTKFKNLKKIQAAVRKVEDEFRISECDISNSIQSMQPEIDLKNLAPVVRNFIEIIVDFMHYSYHYATEKDMIQAILRNCPLILGEKNVDGLLPIQCYVRGHSPCMKSFAERGRELGIGGSDARGGLLTLMEKGPNQGRNLLQTISFQRDVIVLKSLLESEPPLFEKQDIKRYHLLKYSIMDFRPEMNEKSTKLARLLIRMDSSSLHYLDDHGNRPIFYCSKDPNLMRVMIQSSIKSYPSDEAIGGLFSPHESGECIIEYILKKMYNDLDQIFEKPDEFENEALTEQGRNELAWDMIEETLYPFDDVPILHKTIEKCPQYIQKVLERFPDSVHVRDGKKRLPIHTALETGLPWSTLVPILHANNQYLQVRDPFTKWPPFVVAAATGVSCDLRTIYYILRRNPEHMEVIQNVFGSHQRTKKRKF